MRLHEINRPTQDVFDLLLDDDDTEKTDARLIEERESHHRLYKMRAVGALIPQDGTGRRGPLEPSDYRVKKCRQRLPDELHAERYSPRAFVSYHMNLGGKPNGQ